MIKERPDGRFYVSVRCPDNVRRWRICPDLARAQFFEAIYRAGWFNGILPKSRQKPQRKSKRLAWNLNRVRRGLIAKLSKVFRG